MDVRFERGDEVEVKLANERGVAPHAPSAPGAGRGKNPASPQPTPNARLPNTSLGSTPRARGRAMGARSNVGARWPEMAKATARMGTAPAMTSASEGSQAPARSRK